MKNWSIKVRLALSLTGHIVLLLFLAFYLNASLLSIRRHDAEIQSRQTQLANSVQLVPLLNEMETDLFSYLRDSAPENLKHYQTHRVQLENELVTDWDTSPFALDTFEAQQRQLIRQWVPFADAALKITHPSPVQLAALRTRSEQLQRAIAQANQQVHDEAALTLQGIRDEETDETRGRLLIMWGLVGLITSATTLIQYFTTNTIIQPLQKLSLVLRRFQNGETTVRADLKSGGEIQTLGEIFNSMASSIQRNQDDLHQANALLEQRVAEKTRELGENNLKLQDASRLKDQFFATLSHELRTPLTPILACAYLLREENRLTLDEEKTVQTIERNAHTLSRMIDELLNLSAVINQKVSLTREKTELNSWANLTLENLRPAWEKKRLQLIFHPSVTPLEAEIDPARLAQILTNLINNGIKFTPAGGMITVRLRAETDKILLTVTDTGVGLPEEEISRVFEMFHQAEANRNNQEGGLGIGLTVARSLAELHGGGLTARSAGRDQGATFTLWLPRHATSPVLNQENQPPLRLDKLQGRRLLLVEDSADALEALQRILTRRGCEVFTARDGEEGLAVAREKKPEIILSDIGLPRLSGLEMMTQLRQDPAQLQVITLALSGLGRAEDVAAAEKAGFDFHLLKPIEIPLLERTLIQALEEKEKACKQKP